MIGMNFQKIIIVNADHDSTDLFKTYLDRFYYDHQYDIV